jgi:tubulin beta
MQAGQCGNQMGTEFWEVVCGGHGIGGEGEYCGGNDAQLGRVDVLYHEASGGRCLPCAAPFDLEPSVIDAARVSPLGELFHPGSLVNQNVGAGNNWVKGHYTEGAEMTDQVLGAARMEAENTNFLQGFQVCESIGGGSGSNMGTREKPLTAASSRCQRS